MIKDGDWQWLWVVDFPALEWNADEKRWDSLHHPFTAPKDADIPLLDSAPEQAHGKHYDVVCNGYELSSGSIRIHNSQLQRRIFHLLGYTDPEVDERFGHMIEAFEYGAPPHGGSSRQRRQVVRASSG